MWALNLRGGKVLDPSFLHHCPPMSTEQELPSRAVSWDQSHMAYERGLWGLKLGDSTSAFNSFPSGSWHLMLARIYGQTQPKGSSPQEKPTELGQVQTSYKGAGLNYEKQLVYNEDLNTYKQYSPLWSSDSERSK